MEYSLLDCWDCGGTTAADFAWMAASALAFGTLLGLLRFALREGLEARHSGPTTSLVAAWKNPE